MGKTRLEAFSDGVLAIIITIINSGPKNRTILCRELTKMSAHFAKNKNNGGNK